jgi:GNAT superfamily N-acetyltransferase
LSQNQRVSSGREMMIVFEELNDVKSDDFGEAISIYVDSISAAERHSVDVIKERVANKKERMFIGRLDNEIVMVALIWPLTKTKFILFDYMAVKEKYRNEGVGSSFVKNIFKIGQIKNKTFVLEVDDPQDGDDRGIRKRRVQFYKRNGAKEIKGVKYFLPPLQGNSPTQMIIMLISPRNEAHMPGQLLKRLFKLIYKELYSRNESDPLLKSFIDVIPPEVEIG